MNRAFLIVGLLILFLFSCSKMPVYPQAPLDGAVVKIALKDLREKKPVFYTFPDEGRNINYFVVQVDGNYQSYFDACAKCFRKRKGYRPAGERIICRACDVNYSVYDLKEGIGSCYPIKLEGRVEGDFYVIDKRTLVEGKKFF